MSKRQTIDTRVCIDDMLGPYDAKVDPTNLWNGWLSPHFTLDTVRKLSARTLEMADKDGFDCMETVHVIDGRADSPSSVHVIEGGTDRDGNPQRVTVHVRWPMLDEDPKQAVSIFKVRPGTELRITEPAGEGEPRAVVFVMSWQWWDDIEGGEQAGGVYQPDDEGRYAVGAWSWCWHYAGWWCICGANSDWHKTECLCGLTRDGQPKTPLGIAAVKAGLALRTLAPEATSALVDLTDLARVCAVFAGDTEIDTADDTGPFDTETLGWADRILRDALDDAAPADLEAAGWEHVPDEESARLYRITFPVPPTH
ncbi:hypothetical protein AB4Z54_19890 [Streptomyces sp. MCAF7]